MRAKLKILYITPYSPLRAAHGAQHRVLNIARLLGRLGDVSFVIAPAGPEEPSKVSQTSSWDVRMRVRPLTNAWGTGLNRFRHRVRHELDPRYLATDSCHASEADRRALVELMQEFGLVWIHTIRSANIFGIDKWPNSVLDVDDLPSHAYMSRVRSGTNPARRLLDRRLSWIWRRRERLLTERFSALVVCNEQDRQSLGDTPQTHLIPNGFNILKAGLQTSSARTRIGFMADFRHLPNATGIEWFIRHVWPLVRLDVPRAELRLVGAHSEGYLTGLAPNIKGLGWLEDPTDEIATWCATIAPIQWGAGTRVKIAEAFARKCPVVATRFAALGYDVRDGAEILFADSAQDFASACIMLMRNPEMGEALSEAAHKLFLGRYTWDSFQSSVDAVVEECLRRNNPVTVEVGLP